MKLYSNALSPYGRKVMVVIRSLGLLDRIELVDAQPRLRPEEVVPINPVGKIPFLVMADGTVLKDSPVVAEYLCAEFDGARLLPAGGEARWRILTEVADADAVIEAAILVRNERLRPAEQQSPDFIAWNLAKAQRTVDAWEDSAQNFAGRFDLGVVAVGCALGYVSRRLPEFDGLETHAGLAKFYRELLRHEAFALTEPQ